MNIKSLNNFNKDELKISSSLEENQVDKFLYTLYKIMSIITIIVILLCIRLANASPVIYSEISQSYSTDLVVRDNEAKLDDISLLPQLVDDNKEIELHERARNWQTSRVDGSVKMFSFAVTTANSVYATVCGASTLTALGIIAPAGAAASLTACAVGLAVLAMVNWASFIVSSHNDNGGWNWDSSSGADKRTIEEHHIALLGAGVNKYRSIIENLYTVECDDDTFDGLVLNKRDIIGNSIMQTGKVVSVKDNTLVLHGYQMVVNANGHNKSLFAEPAAINNAIETYKRCGGDNECYQKGILIPLNDINNDNNTFVKRDSSGAWASYNDWGDNGGYVHDWWYWDEFSKAAKSMAYDESLGIVDHVQPCTTSTQCYGYHPKWCAAGGMSEDRTVDSAFVGEVYMLGYGGVDGVCDDG